MWGLLLQACSTLQSATFSQPLLVTDSLDSVQVGDGIAWKTQDACVKINHAWPSAVYRDLFVGPLVFPIFPVDILSSSSPSPDHFWIAIAFQPRHSDLFFAATGVVLTTRDGATLPPDTVRVHYLTQPPQKPKPVDELENPLIIPYGSVSVQIVRDKWSSRPKVTVVALSFKKPHPDAQMASLVLKGLQKEDGPLPMTEIAFSPVSKLRLLISGTTMENVSYQDFMTLHREGICGLLKKQGD